MNNHQSPTGEKPQAPRQQERPAMRRQTRANPKSTGLLAWWPWLVGLMLLISAGYWTAQKKSPKSAAFAGAKGVPLKRQHILRTGPARQAFAIDPTGHVWTWGGDDFSAAAVLPADMLKARKISGPGRIVALAAQDDSRTELGEGGKVSSRTNNLLALHEDGTVWMVGEIAKQAALSDQASVQLTKVPGLSAIRSIAVAQMTAYAVDAQGKLWGWGANSWGQLGAGGQLGSFVSVPALVTAPAQLQSVQSVAKGASLIGIDAQGQVWGWGSNEPLLLPMRRNVDDTANFDPDFTPQPLRALNADEYGGVKSPPYVHDAGPVVQLQTRRASFSGGIVIHGDRSVSVWGLGNEDRCLKSSGANLPSLNSTLGPAASVAVAGHGRYSVKTDGSLWMWGSRDKFLQPGGMIRPCMAEPGQLLPAGSAVEVVSGYVQHMLKADGGVLVWGDMMPPAEPDRNIKVVVFEEALPVTGLPKLLD